MLYRKVSNKEMEAIFYYSENNTKRKTILLLTGSQGGLFSDKYKFFAEKLVSSGYAVLDLAYFRKGSLPVSLKKIKLEYFEKALSWLSEQPEVIVDEYAVLGTSKGAELALVLASRYPQFKAVVAAVPSNVVFQGIGLPYLAGSSWTHRGKQLAFVPFAVFPWIITGGIGAITGNFNYLYKASLKQSRNNKEAEIPVEKINGPVQLISVEKDSIWPSKMMCENIVSRLSLYKFPYYKEHITFNAKHWVLAKRECRESILEFLKKYFTPA